MSFGKSPDDYRELAGAAHATLLNARKACGDGDALTLSISSLHHVLSRLSADVEASEKQGGSRAREGDNRWRELATLARDCARLLKVLNQVLEKYNSLSEEKRKTTKLWRRVKFSNGEMLDLDKIQGEMGTYTQAISLFLELVEMGAVGTVEGYMDVHGAELREIKHTLHWVIAKMLTLEYGKGARALRHMKAGIDEMSVWEAVREELMGEGWATKVLDKHHKVIMRYVSELGERGVLDPMIGEEPEINWNDDNSNPSQNKNHLGHVSTVVQDDSSSESESESESSLDESGSDDESGSERPLGRRRPSVLLTGKTPDNRKIGFPSRKRSLDEIESSEDDSEDGLSINRAQTTILGTSTQNMVSNHPITGRDEITASDIQKIEKGVEILDIAKTTSMTSSISSLPPLPLSRPRSFIEDDDTDKVTGGQQHTASPLASHSHLPLVHSTTDSGRTNSELLPSQTFSMADLPPLPVSRPRSRNSVLSTTESNYQSLMAPQVVGEMPSSYRQSTEDPGVHARGTSLGGLAHDDRGSDLSSDESLASEDDSKRAERPVREREYSTIVLSLVNDPADKVPASPGNVDLSLQGILNPAREPKIPCPEISGPDPSTVSISLNSHQAYIDELKQDESVKTAGKDFAIDASKSGTVLRPSLVIPVMFKEPVVNNMTLSPVKKEYFGKDSDEIEQESESRHSPLNINNMAVVNTTAKQAMEPTGRGMSSIGRNQSLSATRSASRPDRASERQHEDGHKNHRSKNDVSLRTKSDASLKAINSESSIARPQIPRNTGLSYSKIALHKKRDKSTPIMPSIGGKESTTTHLLDAKDSTPMMSRRELDDDSLPSLPTMSSHQNPEEIAFPRVVQDEDSSSDESERSYLVIKGATIPQISYDNQPESIHVKISQTQSTDSVITASALELEERGKEIASHSAILDGGVDGDSPTNTWSVILSQVGDDHESTLLETSGVWAQSTATGGSEPAIQAPKESRIKGESKTVPINQIASTQEQEIHTRSRNVTLVGDSDDEPRPPIASEMWFENVQLAHLQSKFSDNELLKQRIDRERDYESDIEGSVTVPGDSEEEPLDSIKGGSLITSVILPTIHHNTMKGVIKRGSGTTSDHDSSDGELAGVQQENRNNLSLSSTYNAELLHTQLDIKPQRGREDSIKPMTFCEKDPNSYEHPIRDHDNKISELGPRFEAKKSVPKSNRIKHTTTVVRLADQSGEVERRAEEYQVPSEKGKLSRKLEDPPPSTPTSKTPITRAIPSVGESGKTWWWISDDAARARYQPKVEDVNDEDSLPGAHPNCWSNDSGENSQVGSDMKTAIGSSSSKDTEPDLAQYLNPFKENSALKSYRINATKAGIASEDEASSFSFPSSDENDELRRYRSGKQIVYEDPDLSFNSALEGSSGADDESDEGKQKARVEATAEQKEAFRKGIKADRYRKKRYRLEKGKEAVWGSASEREERRQVRVLRKKGVISPKNTGGKKTVTFEIDGHPDSRRHTSRAERTEANSREICQAFVEDVRDEEFLPGAHPNCEAGLSPNEALNDLGQHTTETSAPLLIPAPKIRVSNSSVSPSKSASSTRHAKPKRGKGTCQPPQSDDDKDEDLRRYRREDAAQMPQDDAAPSWRSTRAYRNKKTKERRISHGEDEKFWDEPSSWGGEAGSSEDDWGETYRSDNSRNSSIVAIGGCTCCVAEVQTKRRRQHYRSPPVIHHPDLNPTNPFLPDSTSLVAVPKEHARRRSSIDPWSPDPPTVRRHRREKTSESSTYHVPDAPAPVLNNSTRPELPARRRTENAETSPQASKPDLARRRVENIESSPQVVRPDLPRRTIRTAVREHSPTNVRLEMTRRKPESSEELAPTVRPDTTRRITERKQSPTRPDIVRRRTDITESAPQLLRPDIGARRRTADREHSPPNKRPEISRRGTVDREHRPRDKILRFDIK